MGVGSGERLGVAVAEAGIGAAVVVDDGVVDDDGAAVGQGVVGLAEQGSMINPRTSRGNSRGQRRAAVDPRNGSSITPPRLLLAAWAPAAAGAKQRIER